MERITVERYKEAIADTTSEHYAHYNIYAAFVPDNKFAELATEVNTPIYEYVYVRFIFHTLEVQYFGSK